MLKVKIIRWSNGFSVEPIHQTIRDALVGYIFKHITSFRWAKAPPTWKYKKVPQKHFCTCMKDRSVYFFHRGQYPAVRAVIAGHLSNFEKECQIDEIKAKSGTKVQWFRNEKFQDRDYQSGLIEFLSEPNDEDYPHRNNKSVRICDLQTGKGKQVPMDTKIKVPGGWKRNGDLVIGDDVTAWDGSVSKVIGVYPQGVLDMYQVTFADGRSVKAGPDHLWRVYRPNWEKRGERQVAWRVVDTEEMLRIKNLSNNRLYIQLCKSEDVADVEYPIHPWLLGALLGDGTYTKNTVTMCTPDEFILERVNDTLPEEMHCRRVASCACPISPKVKRTDNVLRTRLIELGLMGKYAWEKFIPEEYLHGSTNQREALIQGLIDTDGTVSETSTISYSTSSKRLAGQVQYLVRSLGGMATVSSKIPKYTHNGEKKDGRRSYTVNIRHPKPSTLCSIPKKLERVNDDNQYAKTMKLSVVSVEPCEPAEAQCIEIDHPDRLYVTDDFIVTHNTYCTLRALSEIGERAFIQVKPKYLVTWLDSLVGESDKCAFDFKKEEIYVIRGGKSLTNLIEEALECRGTDKDIPYKVILCASKTLSLFLSNFEQEGPELYGISPPELYELLGIGVKVYDEAHKEFHAIFKSDIYTHVKTTIGLSATLEANDDVFKREMYEFIYPRERFYTGIKYDRYILMQNYFYSTVHSARQSPVVTERGQDMYSHNAYEKWIMSDPKSLKSYLDLITQWLLVNFVENDFIPTTKALVFCGMTDMCDIVSKHLAKEFPNFTTGSYHGKTTDEELTKDIIISTTGSCGEAIDIVGLAAICNTRAIGKEDLHIQMMGRLRRIKQDVNKVPVYGCFYNQSIEKHMEYCERASKLLKNKTVGIVRKNSEQWLYSK